MLTTARVSIPAPVEARLKQEADYSDNVNDYAREDLIGFGRPIAAAFALLAPVSLSLIYYNSGLWAAAQWTLALVMFVGLGVAYIGKVEWPRIVAKFQSHTNAKRMALADLRCGFGESSFLSNGRAPRFFEYDHGVLVLADAGDLKTLFFNISNDGSDPRWKLYKSGEMHRRIWRWLRLPVSRDVVKFTTEGSKLVRVAEAPFINSIDAWEAINIELGEPLDGSLIHRPFDELTDNVQRLV
jgi:hypothetical protein